MKPCDLCGKTNAVSALEKDGASYVRCPDCQFVYTYPEIEAEETNQEYFGEESFDKYVDKSYSEKKQKYYAKYLKELRPFFGSGKLLEIGCNVGGFLHCARNLGWDVTGVEPVDKCAQYAREKHNLNVVTGILETSDLPENHFDVVYSNAVLEHIPSPASAMRAIARVLKDGGIVYTKTVNYDSYTNEQIGSEWKLLSPRGHVSLFSPQTLTQFNEQAGMEVFRLQSSGVRVRKGAFAGIRKGFYSSICRKTLKGDRIVSWAVKKNS